MGDPLVDRIEGRARTGLVNLRAFDEGVVETLGAKVDAASSNYFLDVGTIRTVSDDPPESSPFFLAPVAPRPGLPGVPVTFSMPEDAFEKYSLPVIVVRREGLDPALQRWHPGLLQYRCAARGALGVHSDQGLVGFDRFEQVDQAVPFDLAYSIDIQAPKRGAPGIAGQANRLLTHVLRVYPPYCRVLVRDSVSDIRSYEAFMDGVSMLDQVADVADRVIGFTVSLRIEGELDLTDPEVRKAVTRSMTLRERRL